MHRRALVMMLMLLAACGQAFAAAPAAPAAAAAARSVAAGRTADSAFAARTMGLERRDGLLVTWLDRTGGRVLLELPPPRGPRGVCGEFLASEAIRTGLGSNPVGLDRGQLGETKVVEFRRVGPRLLLEQPNLRYRARSRDSLEVRAVRESFARSVLWAGEVLAESADGRQLVDFTGFVVRDAHGVAATLKTAGQGAFTLDRERSLLVPEACRAFPDNLVFGALLTFASDEPGPEVRATAPTPQAVTLDVQHQLIRLPDAGYVPRAHDPRGGFFEVLFADYASPVAADLDTRWIVRHRLDPVDPAAPQSRVRKPIVYFVDPGTPEPIRSALVEGASWWARAFTAAGYEDAFRVELLPPDADPLDVRYHTITWVHRATRGWSYGWGIIDPRTGEVVKGAVTLGSLRIRQDRVLFEGLAGTSRTGTGSPDDPVELSLARIRQLAAHEVGHTLGLAHNFAASTYADRGSVMDYPAPRVGLRPDGTLDFADAYGRGVGAWDLQAIRWGYARPAPGQDESALLASILRENQARGLLFLSDADTRPAGAAHPAAAMWDDGADPIAELARSLAVRRAALARFGDDAVAPGVPLGTLAAVLAPVYFHHRYALEAAAKSVGGLDYAYAVRGDGGPPATPVPAARQRSALAAILAALDHEVLDLPETLLPRLLPVSREEPPHREFPGSLTAPAFDALGAAATAADLAVSPLLAPERLARMEDFHRRDPAFPHAGELLDALVDRVFRTPAPAVSRRRAIVRTVQATVARRLIAASAEPRHSPLVRARLEAALATLAAEWAGGGGSREDRELRALVALDLRRAAARPLTASSSVPGSAPPPAPPGPPIGAGWGDCGWAAGPQRNE